MDQAGEQDTMQLTIEQYESIRPAATLKYPGGEVLCYVPTTPVNWRVEGFFEHEPHTLEWIAGFTAGDVFFDIGANVGLYSIWAAKTRGVKVMAFEPESQNFAVLNWNIVINDLKERVSGYCVAISDRMSVSHLHLSSFSAGQALHGFDEPKTTRDVFELDFHEFTPVHSQGSMAMSIDELVGLELPAPRYIKVDIDGLEDKVIAGAQDTLERRETASLLIEINQNLESHLSIVSYLEGLGYSVDDKEAVNYIFRR
ncbi:MAG: FkbM family methyltransferase [Proteobacteria bacterium]|nr:FkbM family methyltransferase [Pseudomonadota bacterium]